MFCLDLSPPPIRFHFCDKAFFNSEDKGLVPILNHLLLLAQVYVGVPTKHLSFLCLDDGQSRSLFTNQVLCRLEGSETVSLSMIEQGQLRETGQVIKQTQLVCVYRYDF